MNPVPSIGNSKKCVSLLITDLDDTIWDWLEMWHSTFRPYLADIHLVTGIGEPTLKKSFKKLHEKYGTSEVSFAFKELDCLKKEDFRLIEDFSIEGQSIEHRYNSNRKNNLKLYPSVRDTLKYIKSQKTTLVGFTESNSFYTKYRIKTLGLDGIFDVIYSPKDHGLPKSVSRHYQKDYWEPILTEFKELPSDFSKPNPNILLQIIKDQCGKIEETAYVGDKLDRDISMANQSNVTSVHAKYGFQISNTAYELLKEVTHWPNSSVKREKESSQIEATHTIDHFDAILGLFNFKSIYENESQEDKKNIVEMWKKTIDVQMHFNDIELKIRSLVLTLMTFIIAGIGFCIKDHLLVYIFGATIPLATLISLIGSLMVYAFYLMDLHWYHNLLHGAVFQGMSIETSLKRICSNFQLTKAIKEKSPLKVSWRKEPLRSNDKLKLFYTALIFILASAAIVSLFIKEPIVTPAAQHIILHY